MKAARCRISGIGEVVKEWKRSSSRRTFLFGSSGFAEELRTVALAAPEDHLFPALVAWDLEIACLGFPAMCSIRELEERA